MAKRKKKIVIDKERARDQKLPVRIPVPPPTSWHDDKSKYRRHEKHKNNIPPEK